MTEDIKKPKVALVGLGHVSEYQLAAFQQSEDLELGALCDIDEQKEVKEHWMSVPRYQTLSQLLALEPTVDTVMVAVPNKDHYTTALEAIRAGKHVIVEKPPTRTPNEFEKLAEEADKQGVVLYTALHAAHAKEVTWFLRELRSKNQQYGPLTGFSSGFFDPLIRADGTVPERKSLDDSWTDSGINALSVILRFVPDLQFEHGTLAYIPPTEVPGMHATMQFMFDGGYYGDITTGWASGLNEKTTRLEYAHTKTTILLDHTNQRVLEGRRSDRWLDSWSDRWSGGLFFEADQATPRLVAHYTGVYSDFAQHVKAKQRRKKSSILKRWRPFSKKSELNPSFSPDNPRLSRACLELMTVARERARMYSRDPRNVSSPIWPGE